MSPILQEALALALQLNPKERLQLVEQVVASVEHQLEADDLITPHPKTGAEIVAMLEQMDAIEFVDPEIEDPVEWVKAQRQKEADRLKPYWDGDK
ncbi:MAG: hypothetical protein SFZ02_18510 [bacterium]|nr:hypothetical protein [bacterium]